MQNVMLIITAVVVSTFTLSAQSDAPIAAPITTDAYPHDQWKSREQYTEIIQSEQTQTQQYLQTPNLPPAELSLYLGYSYLLTYIKTDVDAKLPLDNIAFNNFKRVLQESTLNPQLANMSADEFKVKYNDLVTRLHQ